MSVPVHVNPLNRGFMRQPSHTGACASTTTPPPATDGRFLRSNPNLVNPLAYRDMMTGEIYCPRMAPHRRFVQPLKGCMKRAKSSSCGKSVQFTAPAGELITCRCIITGQKFYPITGPARPAEILNTPVDARNRWAPSPCDEPMTGVSLLSDAEATQYRQEEMALDDQLVLSATNAAQNKVITAPGLPHWFIQYKWYNYLHPCLEGKPRKVRKARCSKPPPSPSPFSRS